MNKNIFIYDGWYYPSISFSYPGDYHGVKYNIPVVWMKKLGGFTGKFSWLPFISIKAVIRKDSKKPFKQFVIDAIKNHPEMSLVKSYYNEEGFTKDKTSHYMWIVETKDGKTIGDIHFAFLLTELFYLNSATDNGTVVQIGFNRKEQKWCGWSHRAIRCFGIGSVIKKGDIGYRPQLFSQYVEQQMDFFNYDKKEVLSDGTIRISSSESPALKKDIYPDDFIPGRGAWIAKTLDDAKQMAMDFAEEVS